MATGIAKHQEKKVLSAWEFYGETSSLPSRTEKAVLSYSQKESIGSLLKGKGGQFGKVVERNFEKVDLIPHNSFILDDNFYALKQLVEQGIKARLFYLDPPYGTGFYFQSRDLKLSYEDNMGQAEYIEFMRRRLILMRECLAEDGSIYIHIGHQMLGHLKVIMDEIFGSENCQNIITRRKCSSKNFTKKKYSNINDFILFYSKGKQYVWNQPGIKPNKEWIDKEYPKIDEYGRRYKLVPVHAPGTRNGETGRAWKGMMPPPGKHWQYPPSKLDEMDKNGDIHWSKNNNPRRKVYLTSNKQLPLTDYWEQYRDAHHQSIKITGYPTEKNLDMLKMIVAASSNVGDIVIDPFCGSGSFLDAARDLDRNYIGIDASFVAAETTIRRMKYGTKQMGDYVKKKKEKDKTMLLPLKYDCLKQKCQLITEKQLYDVYQKNIISIAKI